MTRKTSSLIGTGIGLAAFVAFGLLPSLLYGGYAGVMLASGILGTPITPVFMAKALIGFGMILGVVGVGSLFALAGTVAGAALHSLASCASNLLPAEGVVRK